MILSLMCNDTIIKTKVSNIFYPYDCSLNAKNNKRKPTLLLHTHYLLIQKVTHHIQHFSFLISL